jgi:NifU-like protein involved in Fe-S cluster formation
MTPNEPIRSDLERKCVMDDIYNSKILEFAGNIPLTGTLAEADASAQAHSKLCGSKVKIWLKMDGDTVTGFAHDGAT